MLSVLKVVKFWLPRGRADLKGDLAALRRIGIDIGEMAEIGGHRKVAENRKAVGFGLFAKPPSRVR